MLGRKLGFRLSRSQGRQYAPRLKLGQIAAFVNHNHHRLAFALAGKILLKPLAEMADFHPDDVVFPRAIVRRPAENPPPDSLFFQILQPILNRLFAKVR